jgi:hypothetical protein
MLCCQNYVLIEDWHSDVSMIIKVISYIIYKVVSQSQARVGISVSTSHEVWFKYQTEVGLF